MAQIEIQAHEIAMDEVMMRDDIAASDYENIEVTTKGNKIILIGDHDELANMICEENFRETYLDGVSVEEAKALITN